MHVWLVLWKAYRTVTEAARRQIAGSCLGDSDFRVLEALLHKGSLPVNTIGCKVELTPGSISVAIDRLERRGLVTRKSSSEDRRVHLVELTPEGRAVISKAFTHHAAEMEKLFITLSESDRRTLLKLLKKLGKDVEQQMTADK